MSEEHWDRLVIPAIAPEDQSYRIGPGEDDLYRRKTGEVLLPEREPRACSTRCVSRSGR